MDILRCFCIKARFCDKTLKPTCGFARTRSRRFLTLSSGAQDLVYECLEIPQLASPLPQIHHFLPTCLSSSSVMHHVLFTCFHTTDNVGSHVELMKHQSWASDRYRTCIPTQVSIYRGENTGREVRKIAAKDASKLLIVRASLNRNTTTAIYFHMKIQVPSPSVQCTPICVLGMIGIDPWTQISRKLRERSGTKALSLTCSKWGIDLASKTCRRTLNWLQ